MAGAVSNNTVLNVECETCGKGFEDDRKCDSHLARVCDLGNCNHREFRTPSDLTKHQSIHGLAVKIYTCSIGECNYSSKHNHSVSRHKRTVHHINMT
jgi:hypothetical protein